MQIIENENSIVLQGVNDFNSIHIFECGQCFRWNRHSNDSYIGVAGGRVIVVEQKDDKVTLHNTNIMEFEKFWLEYFDLKRDYSKIKDSLRHDKVLDQAIKFGWGIRILNQDMWECLISFIISANNRIPMIKRAVDNISRNYGTEVIFEGKTYYTFPTAHQLKDASIEDLEQCGAGFRAKYIKNTVNLILEGKVDLDMIKRLEIDDAREELQKLSGVGPKIADCVLLFSAGKHDAFPIDVWVKRVMEYFYSDSELKLGEIQDMAKDLFGDLAGFAQQYLFYYARELKIGK